MWGFNVGGAADIGKLVYEHNLRSLTRTLCTLTFYAEQNMSGSWQLCVDVSSVRHFRSPKNGTAVQGEPNHPAQRGCLKDRQMKLYMEILHMLKCIVYAGCQWSS